MIYFLVYFTMSLIIQQVYFEQWLFQARSQVLTGFMAWENGGYVNR